MRFFERPSVKQVGVSAFCLFVGLAIGNAHHTADVVAGSEAWWRGKVVREVKAARRDEYGDAMEFCMELVRETDEAKAPVLRGTAK